MRNGNGRESGQWLMVDDNGQRTLFQLVEVGKGADAVQLASKLPARGIVVDIALPALTPFDGQAASRSQSAGSRLILLKVRTVSGDEASRDVRISRPRHELVRPDATPPD
jgi:hypothetical protein